jgi:hypothetical protein
MKDDEQFARVEILSKLVQPRRGQAGVDRVFR